MREMTEERLSPESRVWTASVTPEMVNEQLRRILDDPLFQSSKRSSDLLRFIVERSLSGQLDELKERILGIELFGRTPDFDTTLDSAVRVAANKLRKRLALYYAQPGRDEELQIEVPVRSYIAEFRLPQPQGDAESTPSKQWSRRRIALASAASACVLLLLAVFGFLHFRPRNAVEQFWEPLMKGSSPLMICFGSPSNEPEPPQNPASPFDENAKNTVYAVSELRLEVGMSDVQAADLLTTYLLNRGREVRIRPLPGRQLATLRSRQQVLYGMFLNDWRMRMVNGLRFRFQSESVLGKRWIEDTQNPASHKWMVDLSAPSMQVDSDFALITRMRDQTTGQWWVGLTGLTGAGTMAANQLVLDPAALGDALSRLPKDWKKKNLQIVLETKLVQGSPGATTVLATACW